MLGLNKKILICKFEHNPEIVTMNNGKGVARFNIATSEKWIDKRTGEERGHTDWHTIVILANI